MNTFTSENCRVLFLKLDSDFEIRLLQRKLGSDTATSFFALQSQFNKAVCNSPMEVEPAVLVLASRLKVMTFFLALPAGTAVIVCAEVIQIQWRSQDFSKGGTEVMEAKALKRKNYL